MLGTHFKPLKALKLPYPSYSGLYYKHIMTVNDNSSVVTKFETSLTDDAKVIIYDRHMFTVKATGVCQSHNKISKKILFMSQCPVL